MATAEAVLARAQGANVYCLHQIVHNQQVVSRLASLGMVFVRCVEDVPEGGCVLLSAHGVAPAVREAAALRRLRVIDATCPFVAKVHAEVRRFAAEGAAVVCIGHRRHDEVVGVAGEAPACVSVVESPAEAEAVSLAEGLPVAVVTQTTLGAEQVDSVMAVLKRRFPALLVPPSTDICYATRNRQQAVGELARLCSRVLVLGSANSSNSQRLVETARARGAEATLLCELSQLAELAWDGVSAVGVTSGASTPEPFLNEVVDALRAEYGCSAPECLTVVEESSPAFALPSLPELCSQSR